MLVKKILSVTRNFIYLPILNNYRNIYPFSDEKNDYGIQFDQQKIKKKMEQIKNRKEAERAKRAQKIEFMTNNPQSQIGKKIRKYRQSTNTQNLLSFTDPSLEQKPTTLQITGYDQNSIEVDNMVYPPCMVIFKNQVFVWEVLNVESLTLDDFIILQYIAPKPMYAIVGVNQPSKFPQKLKQELSKMVQNFDVLELFQASSQFNVTSNDDLNVVAFMISK